MTNVSDISSTTISDSPEERAIAAEPILDHVIFDELVAMSTSAHESFFEELLGTYRQSANEDLEGVRSSLAIGDAAGVARSAHRLKSSSANWGGKRLAARCTVVEKAARNDDLNAATAPAAGLPTDFDDLMASIEPSSKERAA